MALKCRRAGSRTSDIDRVTLCASHDLRGVDAGRVRVLGEAPEGLQFELGLRSGQTPLLRFIGVDRLQPRTA
jgi:hypothetical protein